MKLALHLLRQPAENVSHFTRAIDRLRNEVKYCSICRMISDGDVCGICSNRKRDHKTICVVESVRDVMSIEKTRQYTGVYHVLGGIISPIEGTGPSDLTIADLVSRVTALTAEFLQQRLGTAFEAAAMKPHQGSKTICILRIIDIEPASFQTIGICFIFRHIADIFQMSVTGFCTTGNTGIGSTCLQRKAGGSHQENHIGKRFHII